jgi:hypothetical protein
LTGIMKCWTVIGSIVAGDLCLSRNCKEIGVCMILRSLTINQTLDQ